MTASFAAGPAPSFRLDVDGPAVALATGAAGGIGARVALGLAEYGADVACVDVSAEGVAKTVDAIEGVGRRALAMEADVADADAMAEAVRRTEAELGPLRHAVNCAGVHDNAPAESMSRAQWQRLVDVNLTGVFTSCQAEGTAMLARGGGSIVNIGSISASIANRGLTQVHYNSAKAGVVHLTTSLALEWADRGVRVNAVSPGYTATPMAKHPCPPRSPPWVAGAQAMAASGSQTDRHLATDHRLPAVRAHLLETTGDHAAARECFLAAAQLATSVAQQRYLRTRAARLPD